jgi:hypothetical protein
MLLGVFAACLTHPSFVTFQHLVAGWILCTGRHTVTQVVVAAGAMGAKHYSSFGRFFRQASWTMDALALCLLRLVIKLVPSTEPLVVPLDDTLARHTGKHIRGASMHHDPWLWTRTKAVFHWGHVFVVLAIIVRAPLLKKCFALPILVRLYRSEKACQKEKRPFLKKTELAAQLIALLARSA